MMFGVYILNWGKWVNFLVLILLSICSSSSISYHFMNFGYIYIYIWLGWVWMNRPHMNIGLIDNGLLECNCLLVDFRIRLVHFIFNLSFYLTQVIG